MRQVHTAGETTFVDYAGQQPAVVDAPTGVPEFVGVRIEAEDRGGASTAGRRL